jgi:hypothetical protein
LSAGRRRPLVIVPLTAFALSPDGHSIAVGGADGLTIVARTEGDGGGDYVVSRGNALPLTCLTWTTAGLFACADEGSAGFTIGASTDEGSSFAPLLRLADLAPAKAPAPGTCTPTDPRVRRRFSPIVDSGQISARYLRVTVQSGDVPTSQAEIRTVIETDYADRVSIVEFKVFERAVP